MTEMFKNRLADVIRRPLITEKATRALELNQYTLEVDHRAAKPEIKAAVEMLFNVRVTAVNTSLLKGKTKMFRGRKGRRNDIKKAIVTLADGQAIDMMGA